ncbi:MAG TPA: CoA-acylating methylmalonate-semialdehyde dehydrogenase [Acidimicrobiales bacterium]|nr:CoA-acylating methylmalonate-semialdehyde dehydrogenase [Acidimicrobiales bacterium]
MSKHVTHWIAGKAWDGTTVREGPIHDPATGEVTGTVDFASAVEIDAAVSAAAAAAAEWGESSLAQRARLLFALRELLDERRAELGALISSEHGKTRSDAEGEVARGLEIVELACGIGHLLKGSFSEGVSRGIDTYSIRQPLGVVCGITPFNFPAMVPMWMFPLAVGCGNAFILKPSEKDPSAAVFLASCAAEVGLPPGVLQVVHGDRFAVDALLDHQGIAAVSFVGSTPVARHVFERSTAAGKRVQALGGAKNHMVVLPGADLDAAADAAVSAGYGSAGERCMAVSVVVAVGGIADDLVGRIAQRVARLRTGPATDPDAEMGPLITAEHRDRVAGYLDSAATDGATVVVDGRAQRIEAAAGGFFLAPSLIDDVTPSMAAYRDEIFGPVLSVVRTGSLDEAIGLVNDSPYGNGAAIFTDDGAAARRFQHEVSVGMVGINVAIPVPVATFPFGGWKSSLFGDTHVYGTDGVHFYTRNKVVTSRWPEPAGGAEKGGVRLGFPGN